MLFRSYDFKKDNNFDELKEAELLANRIQILQTLDPFVGKYYSVMWVRKNLLKQTDDDIEEINAEMKAEALVQQAVMDQQMQQQAAQQQQDQQNQLRFQGQQQVQQAAIQQQVDQSQQQQAPQQTSPAEKDSRDHENKMMDKKIALEKIKNKKSPAKPAPAKKKTAVREARDLGLQYIGEGNYANSDGVVTHVARDGHLIEITK